MGLHPKQKVALTSVLAAVLLTGLKLVVGLVTGSLGIMAEAAHSGLDLGAALMTYFAVRIGDKPPDKEHPYGHEKFESLSALMEVLLLLLTCGWIIYEAVHRLLSGQVEIEKNFIWIAIGVMLISIIVDIGRSRALAKAARKYKSQALEADALHFSSDIWSSAVVIIGLLCVRFGFPVADAISALFVAVWVLIVSMRLAKQTLNVLLDTAAHPGDVQTVQDIVSHTEGIIRVCGLRVRHAGPKMFIDMTVKVRRTLNLEQAHEVVDSAEAQVQGKFPKADIVMHIEPDITPDENILDKVRMEAAALNMPAHNISARQVDGKLNIQFDLELDKNLSFEEAHRLATILEDRISQIIPDCGEVTAHLEIQDPEVETGLNVTDHQDHLVRAIAWSAASVDSVIDCHKVVIHQIGDKLTATLHCHLDKGLSLGDVHTISSKIEQQVLADTPQIHDLIIHCEPIE